MGITVLKSTTPFGYTPICNTCGATLCWDISEREYDEDFYFWDAWKCSSCNPYYKGALERYRRNKESIGHNEGVISERFSQNK